MGRVGIGTRARPFERIATLLDLAAQVARRARGAAQIFELVVMRLEILERDAPVLDRRVRGQEARTVALRQMRAQHEVGRQETPGLRIPVHPAPTHAVRWHEGAPGADRQRLLLCLLRKVKVVWAGRRNSSWRMR